MSILRREARETDEHFYKVHGVRCDFICRNIVTIDPINTPFVSQAPKVKANDVYHSWVQDKLTPVEQHTGWWWRYVVKWWWDLRWKLAVGKKEK